MATQKDVKDYTTKQMGDACEMLIAAELTLAGMPATKMPDNWPDYDLVVQPAGQAIQRISVKSRTYNPQSNRFVDYDSRCQFDWLAVVLLPGNGQTTRRIFIVPKLIADVRTPERKTKYVWDKYWRHDRVAEALKEFENNFCLSPTGSSIANKERS